MPLDKKDAADRAKKTLARGETSDHVALLNAYEVKTAEPFCVS